MTSSFRMLLGVLAVLMLGALANAEETYVYNDHGKRDPFVPLVSASGDILAYEADMSVGEMTLEGILADASGNNLAIVNGKVVKVSDQIGAYKIEVITADHVELSKNTERFTLKLKKGGT